MRQYTNKEDVQKKSYYEDRFHVQAQTPKKQISQDEIYLNDIQSLEENFKIANAYIEIDELVIYIDALDNFDVLKYLKSELTYDMCMELSAIDYIASKGGFEIFYELLSMSKKKRMRVKTFIAKHETLQSVYSIFKMANWSEREMFDMYGIRFLNHPNLKRILMPDDWYDYPLRKTYPLQGDEVAQWYEVDKIFGKEAREIIGPEQRDSAAIDRYDTTRFARLGHEVDYGVDITDGKEPEHTPLAYQEKEGVRFIKKFKEEESVTLKERR